MKTCIFHIGTHKTGTTSLQIFVLQNRAALLQSGLYLPDAGRPSVAPTGNHQFGWDLLVDQKSDDLQRLTEELRANPVEHALVTSEDLSLLYSVPNTLEMLGNAVRAAGYVPKVVLYLRPQAGYAESMYVERIKHDYIRPLSGYVEQILETGRYVPDGSPIQIEFRYSRLIEPWVRVFGRENVFLRVYEPGKPSEFIFNDFMQTIMQAAPGFGRSRMELNVARPRVNESLTFGTLLDTAYAKLLPAGVPQIEPRALLGANLPSFAQELLNQRFALLSRDETLAILEAFEPDNAAIARDYGIVVPFVQESDVAPAGDPIWQKAAAERAIFDQLLRLWLDTRATLPTQ